MKSISNTDSIPAMSQAQSYESLRANANAPQVASNPRAAVLLIEAHASVTKLNQRLADLLAQIDALPAQESALTEDRSKSAAEIREGLSKFKDKRSDLVFEQDRVQQDKADALSHCVKNLFPSGRSLISQYFSNCYTEVKDRALTALAPFFDSRDAAAPLLDSLPAVQVATTHAQWCLERVKGENAEASLAKFVEVITQFNLQKGATQGA